MACCDWFDPRVYAQSDDQALICKSTKFPVNSRLEHFLFELLRILNRCMQPDMNFLCCMEIALNHLCLGEYCRDTFWQQIVSRLHFQLQLYSRSEIYVG